MSGPGFNQREPVAERIGERIYGQSATQDAPLSVLFSPAGPPIDPSPRAICANASEKAAPRSPLNYLPGRCLIGGVSRFERPLCVANFL